MGRKNVMDPKYDVLVVGGGINGTGIARELALRGVKTLLCEKNDFSSGTSSKSSKLVHGGLRYLEQFQFSVVKESLQERHHLIQYAPHLVKPLRFTFPLYKKDGLPLWKMKAGLTLYDWFAGDLSLPKHQMLSSEAVTKHNTFLNEKDLIGAAEYSDGMMDDSRLCIETALHAKQLGADVYNYASVHDIKIDNTADLPIMATITHNQYTHQVRCKRLVLAVGPWTNLVCHNNNLTNAHLIKPSKGIHLVTDNFVLDKAVIIRTQLDKRVMFIIPWGKVAIIGTTDTKFEGSPDDVRITDEDIRYIQTELRAHFKESILKKVRVHTGYAGLRPLVNQAASTAKVSREEQIDWVNPFTCSVYGGKYTTFRQISENVTKTVLKSLDKTLPFKSVSQYLSYYSGIIDQPKPIIKQIMQAHGLPKLLATHIINRYVTHYKTVIKAIQNQAHLKEPIPNTNYYAIDIYMAVHHEMATTLSDIIYRRTQLYLEPNILGLLDTIAHHYQKITNYDKEKVNAEKQVIINQILKQKEQLPTFLITQTKTGFNSHP